MTDDRFPQPPADVPAITGLTSKVTKRQAVQMIGGAMFGAAVAFSFPGMGRHAFENVDPWVVVALPLVWYGTVFIHELGHLLAGVAVGMRPFAFCVGPLRLDFGAQRWSLQRNRLIAQSGGLALCFPTERSRGRWPFVALIAGGPLASGLLAIVAVAVAKETDGTVSGIALATAAIAGFLTLLNLVPMRVGGYTTDGGQIVGALRSDPTIRARLAVLALVAQSHGGARPRDLDAAAIAALHGTGDAELDAYAHVFDASVAIDRAEHDAARAAITALAGTLRNVDPARLPPPTRRALALSVAGWLGQYGRDATGARAWLEYGRGALVYPLSLACAEASVAFAEGRADDVRRHIADVRSALKDLPDKGAAIAMSDEIGKLEAALDAPAKAAA